MSLLKKTRMLTQDPVMLKAYCNWVLSTTFRRKAPGIEVSKNTLVREWISFSEYWSFQEGIPLNEYRFLQSQISGAESRQIVAFDIGANIGLFTCAMASAGANVHSFEPVPQTFCRLSSNVKNNNLLNDVILNCIAVGENREMVEFLIDEAAAATNRMASQHNEKAERQVGVQSVASISLDEYCSTNRIDYIDFVKLDVEGMEPYVLRGAKKLLEQKRIGSFLIEVCPVNLQSVGQSVSKFYNEILRSGYVIYELTREGNIGNEMSEANLHEIVLTNAVLLPK